MTTKLVALCGYARVGKDTIYGELQKSGWKRAAFADAIKHECWDLASGLSLDLNKPDDKSKFRPVLVAYGIVARSIDPDFWINRLWWRGNQPTCITDLRYLNEAKWVWAQGGTVFVIRRYGIIPANCEENDSISEILDHAAIKFIDNNGTPAQAAQQILDILGKE